MPRPMGPNRGMPEKSKNFKASIKRLFNSLNNWRYLLIFCLILAMTSAILSLVAPNKLSSLTDTITLGIQPNISEKIINYKVPHKKAFTEQELFKINCFRKACADYGFREEFEKPFGLKMKKSGSSLYLVYNVYQDSIDLDYRGNKGLFDSFYTREIIAKVYNRMHEYLGDGLKDNYSMQEDLNKLNREVKDIMEKFK